MNQVPCRTKVPLLVVTDVTSVQPYYVVLKYKKGYIFNFLSPIFSKVLLIPDQSSPAPAISPFFPVI